MLHVFLAAISAWMRRRAHKQGIRGTIKTGAVTAIQRFDSALALNVHFRSLLIDGVYARDGRGVVQFHALAAPSDEDVAKVAERVHRRVARLIDVDEEDQATAQDPLLAALAAASLRQPSADSRPRTGRRTP